MSVMQNKTAKPAIVKMGFKFLVAFGLFGLLSLGTAQAADDVVTTLDPSEKLIAIVNGISIRQYEYDIAKQSLQDELVNLSTAQQQQKILQFLIDLKLMSEAARADGFDEHIEYKQKTAYLAEQTLNNLYFLKKVLEEIDDNALRTYYNQEMIKIIPSSESHARHILFEDENKGEAVLELLEDGADFAEMAAEHSTGPTKTQGGDLGYFSDGEMVAEFSAALAGLEIGQYTKQLVKTQFGYHIIKLEDIREKPLPTFEKVKQSLYGILVQNRVDELSNELRKSAQIELFLEQEPMDAQKIVTEPIAGDAADAQPLTISN